MSTSTEQLRVRIEELERKLRAETFRIDAIIKAIMVPWWKFWK